MKGPDKGHPKRKNAKFCRIEKQSTWRAFKRHFKRCNYLSFCQMNYDLKHHPSPVGNGWEIINGKCRPVRYTVPALPNQFVFIPSIDDDESASEVSEYGDSSGSDDE